MRWAICAPGLNVDALMFQSSMSLHKKLPKFLAEDLFIQSMLIGDGATVNEVINPPGAEFDRKTTFFQNHQDDEIFRNEKSIASFAGFIRLSSTNLSGKLSDDILRMCLLESLGGGGSASPLPHKTNTFYFGEERHTAAVRKRLNLSAATASPGKQSIAVPLVRALCTFAGGLGETMIQCYRQKQMDDISLGSKNSTELWIVPPGSLHAAEFAIIAAARLVVMNLVTEKHGRIVVNASKRHDRLSLLLPCVLHSAFKLRCGMLEYARATAEMNGVNVSSHDKGDKGDGLGSFIALKCPQLCPVISACDDSAKMVIQTLMESGDRTLEYVLLRGSWRGDVQNWLVDLNSKM